MTAREVGLRNAVNDSKESVHGPSLFLPMPYGNAFFRTWGVHRLLALGFKYPPLHLKFCCRRCSTLGVKPWLHILKLWPSLLLCMSSLFAQTLKMDHSTLIPKTISSYALSFRKSTVHTATSQSSKLILVMQRLFRPDRIETSSVVYGSRCGYLWYHSPT